MSQDWESGWQRQESAWKSRFLGLLFEIKDLRIKTEDMEKGFRDAIRLLGGACIEHEVLRVKK